MTSTGARASFWNFLEIATCCWDYKDERDHGIRQLLHEIELLFDHHAVAVIKCTCREISTPKLDRRISPIAAAEDRNGGCLSLPCGPNLCHVQFSLLVIGCMEMQ